MKQIVVVLITFMSLFAVPAVWADFFTVTGEIIAADRELSVIVLEDEYGELVTIIGFPFHNLELQLDELLVPLDPDHGGITIEVGDCVTVEYSEKQLISGDVVNKWETLIAYCEECTQTEPCFEGDLEREPHQFKPSPCPPESGQRWN